MGHENPIIEAIESGGHVMGEVHDNKKVVIPNRFRCKADGEDWPCTAIREAQQKNRERKLEKPPTPNFALPRTHY
jgi:hypothetical protein